MSHQPSPYTLQPITALDTDAVLATGALALLHDALRLATFPASLVDPARPDEEAAFRRRRFLRRLATPGVVMHKIVVVPGGDGGGGEEGVLAGFSNWVAPAPAPQKDGGEQGKEEEAGKEENALNPTGEMPACARREVFEEQLRLHAEAQERVVGPTKNFWYLAGLATHPDYQGKGVGTALVRWGIEQAERDGVPVYLEATPQGAFLYKKLGFETVEEIDMSKWMENGEQYKISCMIKRPSSKTQ